MSSLRVMITRDDLLALSVDVVDVGLPDHHLLRWQVPMSRPPPVYNTIRSCVRGTFLAAISSASSWSRLCNSESWSRHDVDSLACLYNTELEAVFD